MAKGKSKAKNRRKRRDLTRKTNPHGVNQYTAPDPRSQAFLAYYLDRESSSYSNALQSALRAGYAQEYAESITSQMPDWLAESLGDMELLGRAVRNLSEGLDIDPVVQAMGAFGPIFSKIVKVKKVKGKKRKIVTRVPIMVTNTKLLHEKLDVSKFVAQSIGKSRFGKETAKPAVVVPVQVNINEDRQAFA